MILGISNTIKLIHLWCLELWEELDIGKETQSLNIKHVVLHTLGPLKHTFHLLNFLTHLFGFFWLFYLFRFLIDLSLFFLQKKKKIIIKDRVFILGFFNCFLFIYLFLISLSLLKLVKSLNDRSSRPCHHFFHLLQSILVTWYYLVNTNKIGSYEAILWGSRPRGLYKILFRSNDGSPTRDLSLWETCHEDQQQ